MLKKSSFFKIWNIVLLFCFVFFSDSVVFGAGGYTCSPGCGDPISCACSSHLEGTKVLLANGIDEVKIEKLKIGDTLMGFDAVSNLEVNNIVTSVKESFRDRIYIVETNGRRLSLTENHPVYVGEKKREDQSYVGYKRADSLRIGEEVFLIGANNKLSKYLIDSIIVIEGNRKVYTITTSGTNNYFANGLLVHNKICYDPCTVHADDYSCGDGDYCRSCTCKECGPYDGGEVECGYWNRTYDCSDDELRCNECETCSDKCGQDMNCWGNKCPSDDAGDPDTPVCTSLGTVTSMPVSISWTSGGDKADNYEYRLDGVGGNITSGTAVPVTVAGGNHSWQARSRNIDCFNPPEASDWSGVCTFCYENVDCSVSCGQLKTCGGSCPPCCIPDIPAIPTIISPAGSVSNVGATLSCGQAGITLRWNQVMDGKADGYQADVYRNGVGSTVFTGTVIGASSNSVFASNVGASGGYYSWWVRSYDNHCVSSLGYSNWSNAGYFCRECEVCSQACNQAKNCGGNCTGEDSGAPGAPTVVSPLGSALNPVILLDTTPLLDWEGSDPLTDSYEITVINPSGGVVWTGTTTAGTTNISVGTALSNNITYRWYVRALNSTCSPYGQNSYSSPSGYGYFRINSPPVIGNFYIFNVGNAEVVAEAGSRNHICQSDFNGSRSVNFRLNVTDADGVNDIAEVTLDWNGDIYVLVRGATWATGATYSTTILYNAGDDDSELHEITATALDTNHQGPVNQGTGRNWKVWNCQVPVNGNLYDGSADHSCAGGFNTLADSAMEFNALVFNNSTQSVVATVTVPNSFVVDMGSLIWNRSYLPLINGGDNFNPNGDLAATGRLTRMTDLGTGVLTCPVSDQFDLNVSPYSANPSAKIDFSFIRDQESWYQVRGGGIRAGGSIKSGVPVTANALERYLTLGRNLMTTIDNGVVSYANNFLNTNGYNDEAYGSPHSWWKNSSMLPATRYGYQYFYNNLYVKAGVGVIGDTWDKKPSEGVFFVNGDLNIDSDFTLAADKFLMVVVSGNITISNTVNRIDGIYVSDGEISATGNSNNALEINGMLYSRSSVRLARSFTNKTLNNTSPATIVNYRPSLLFNMPIKISKVISGWRED